MSTTTSEAPDFGSPFLPMGVKSTQAMYMPTVSATSAYGMPPTSSIYSNTGGPEFTNLTPLMSTPFSLSQSNGGGSSTGESSNLSSASSSRTRLANIGMDDSGMSLSSNNGGSGLHGEHLMSLGYCSPQMKTEEDLDPIPRDRCNTWPLRRPTLDINAQTSPLIHDLIPEEENVYDSGENLSRSGGMSSSGQASATANTNSFSNEFSQNLNLNSTDDTTAENGTNTDAATSANKKSTTRRNAWGNLSYADLITQAIQNSPEQRLTLSQVYEWMVQNVPYFRDKGDSNSSAGWKNSIRHNLSLHSRFTRIQNEGAGKSSWWVINPDAKAGRNPRRRAVTMDSNKADLKTAAKRAGKRGNKGQRGAVGNSVSGSTVSVNDIRFNEDDALNTAFDNFRPRTQSNVSVGASGRISPLGHGFDEFDFPPYSRTGALGEAANSNADMNDILGKTDSIRIDSGYRSPPQGNSNAHLNGMKMEVVDRPPSYSELNPVRSNMSGPMQQNMIRSPFNGQQQSLRGMPLGNVTMPNNTNNYYPMYMNNGMLPSQSTSMQQPAVSWSQNPMDPYMNMGPQPTQQQMGPSIFDTPSNQNLPNDLDSLTIVPDPALMEYDMDALMRHEMEQQNTSHLQFDL